MAGRGYFDKEQNKEQKKEQRKVSKKCVDGWMDGWMDGCMDGWMDEYLMAGRCSAMCQVGASTSTRSTLASPNTGSSASTFFLSCNCKQCIHGQQLVIAHK